MTKSEAEAALAQAASELNRAIRAAISAGLRVEVDTILTHNIGEQHARPLVQVSVSEPARLVA